MPFADPDALAEKLDQYANAMTAFACVQTLTFLVSLLNKDFREGVLSLGPLVASIFLGIMLMFLTGFTGACFVGQDALIGKARTLPRAVGLWITLTRITRLVVIFIMLICEYGVLTFLQATLKS